MALHMLEITIMKQNLFIFKMCLSNLKFTCPKAIDDKLSWFFFVGGGVRKILLTKLLPHKLLNSCVYRLKHTLFPRRNTRINSLSLPLSYISRFGDIFIWAIFVVILSLPCFPYFCNKQNIRKSGKASYIECICK